MRYEPYRYLKCVLEALLSFEELGSFNGATFLRRDPK